MTKDEIFELKQRHDAAIYACNLLLNAAEQARQVLLQAGIMSEVDQREEEQRNSGKCNGCYLGCVECVNGSEFKAPDGEL